MFHTLKTVLNQALAATAVAFLLSIPVSFSQATPPPAPEEAAVQAAPETTELDALTPLATLVADGESATAGDYNAANNGYPMDLGKHGLRSYFGRDASQITIGEIMYAQANYNLHAVGRYQIIGVAMRSMCLASVGVGVPECPGFADAFPRDLPIRMELQTAAAMRLVRSAAFNHSLAIARRPSDWRALRDGVLQPGHPCRAATRAGEARGGEGVREVTLAECYRRFVAALK